MMSTESDLETNWFDPEHPEVIAPEDEQSLRPRKDTAALDVVDWRGDDPDQFLLGVLASNDVTAIVAERIRNEYGVDLSHEEVLDIFENIFG